jgi:ABC-2 type transport system permease protein
MTLTLIRKQLRDVRVALFVVGLLLVAFECLWVKITERISGKLVPLLSGLAAASRIGFGEVQNTIFEGPGRILRTLIGGESVNLDNAMQVLSIGYVHPLIQVVLCIWAIGRASGAVAGEIDRGTMELLLAQPLPRWRVLLAHLCVDVLTIPILCLCLWAGSFLGTWLVGPIHMDESGLKKIPFKVEVDESKLALHPAAFGPALVNTAALVFAVSGYTMWLSARGRFRNRVLGIAIVATLLQFLVNVVGQLWDAVEWLRQFTVFYYYQPQQIALNGRWTVDLGGSGEEVWVRVNVLVVLFLVGIVGYALALRTFTRRDLPAPL